MHSGRHGLPLVRRPGVGVKYLRRYWAAGLGKGADMSEDDALQRYAQRVGWGPLDLAQIPPGDHRRRQISRLAQAAPLYSIEAEVVSARHCNSGYAPGDKFVLDVDGNFIAKLCPKRLCVYLAAQLVVPVALINERLSEGLNPNQFHFMRMARCPDVGVECGGYGQVMLKVSVAPRQKDRQAP
jgi:hypothetical protein